MEIYLIRHTTPAIEKGRCYGQSDIDVSDSFYQEAKKIKSILPLAQIEKVYSSPLKRCKKLSRFIFPDNLIEYRDELKEIYCGDWELKNWNEINNEHLDHWMSDFVNVPFPGGESFLQLSKRTDVFLQELLEARLQPIVVITHAGVIRSLLSTSTRTLLKDSFDNFKLDYGCIAVLKKDSGVVKVEFLKAV